MAVAHFECLEECDLIEVVFVTSDGVRVPLRLLVDSGFTGVSSFVLSDHWRELALANLSSAHAAGALTGRQERALVRCSIPSLGFERNLAAILTDVGTLSLAPGVHGMAELTFLRQFKLWGAERVARDAWQFFLVSEEENP